MVDITPIINAVIALIATLITYHGIRYPLSQGQNLRAKAETHKGVYRHSSTSG